MPADITVKAHQEQALTLAGPSGRTLQLARFICLVQGMMTQRYETRQRKTFRGSCHFSETLQCHTRKNISSVAQVDGFWQCF